MMVIIVITLLAAYDGMSAVSTCIGDIFGLHSINPGYDSASASLQLMFTAIRTATLFACRKERISAESLFADSRRATVDFLRPFSERKDDLICMKTGKYKQVSF